MFMFVSRSVSNKFLSFTPKRFFTTERPYQLALSVGRNGRRVFQKAFLSADYEFPDQLCHDFQSLFHQWPVHLGGNRPFLSRDWNVIQEVLSERSCEWVAWTPKELSHYRFGIVLLGDKKKLKDEMERYAGMADQVGRYVRLSRAGPYGTIADRTFSAREANDFDGNPRLRAFFNAQFERLWWGNRSLTMGEHMREMLPH